MSKKLTIEDIMTKVNKEAGKKVIDYAGNVINVYHLRRPSGIMQLDMDTAGGLSACSVNFLSGPDGGGKTRLLLAYIAQQQRYLGNKCCVAYGAVEHPIDHFYWRKVGVKIPVPKQRIEEEQENRKLRGKPPFTKEEIKELQTGIGRIYVYNGNYMEEILETTLDLLESRECQIIGIDSMSALMPKDTVEKTLDDSLKMAAHASNMTTFFKKYHALIADLDNPVLTTLILTQQVRSNKRKAEAPSYMQKYLSDFATSDAYATKHAKTMDILITSGEREKEKTTKEGKGNTISKQLRWELTKAKAGAHEGVCGEVTFDFSIPGGIDFASTVLQAGLRCGAIVEKAGGLTFVKEDGSIGHEKFKNLKRDEVIALLMSDVYVDYLVRQEILDLHDINCRYKDDNKG